MFGFVDFPESEKQKLEKRKANSMSVLKIHFDEETPRKN